MNEARDDRTAATGAAPRAGGGPYLDVLTVLAGGILFCLLLFLLFRHLFPASLWRGAAQERAESAPAARELTFDTAAQPASARVAAIVSLDGRVQVRYADSLSWGTAQASQSLGARDAVQTGARSSVRLSLEAGGHLQLGERSLIVLGDAAPDPFAGGPPARRGTLLEGVLTGRLGGPEGAAIPLELDVGGGDLFLAPAASGGGELSFVVSRNPDASSSISLYAGRAQLAGNGAREVLEPGFGVTLDARGAVIERRALPGTPAQLQPAGGSEVLYRDVPPRVVFQWSPLRGIGRYRLRVARDSELADLLLDERVSGSSFALSELRAGEHYWTVSALDGWHEGAASRVQRLRIVQDQLPPPLVLEELPLPADRAQLRVRGRTEPGARVYVQGEPVAPRPDGQFTAEVALRPGASLLVVEAADAVGNVSYHSRIVSAGGGERAALADSETTP